MFVFIKILCGKIQIQRIIMSVRDHKGISIDQFNGLYDRGDIDSVPSDHFTNCLNVKFIATSAFGTRDGVAVSQNVATPLRSTKRYYDFPTQTGNTLIVLVQNDAGDGEIYHIVSPTLVYGPLLTLTGMKDFVFLPYAGRGYISPVGYYTATGLDAVALNIEKGLQNEFLYVYAGDGTAARKAAGAPTGGTMTVANGAAGHTDPGFKIFGFVDETISGYLSAPYALTTFTTSAALSVSFTNITTAASALIAKRHLVASINIPSFNGDKTGYDLFFVPGAIIPNDTDNFLLNVSFYDADLLEGASHLIDNFSTIAAGATLGLYHNRLVLGGSFADPSVFRVSAVGEPEAISQIDGLLVVPPDGNPLTNGQELRDVWYGFKRARTVSFVDNGDVPSSWPLTFIDNALGSSIHGIATVLDSGSASTDQLIVCNYKGINLFNGTFINPELSWKVEGFWVRQDRNEFRRIQVVNDPIAQRVMIVVPDGRVLSGNYLNGMTPKMIRWAPLGFQRNINTIAIANIDEVILGVDLL